MSPRVRVGGSRSLRGCLRSAKGIERYERFEGVPGDGLAVVDREVAERFDEVALAGPAGLPNADRGLARVVSIPGSDRRRDDAASIIDALLDRLADRVADAVVARLGGKQAERDEWFDSRQAAEYLGLHRDTLRRLTAARAIPSEQDGRGCRLFFRRTALDEWRRSGGRARHLTVIADAA